MKIFNWLLQNLHFLNGFPHSATVSQTFRNQTVLHLPTSLKKIENEEIEKFYFFLEAKGKKESTHKLSDSFKLLNSLQIAVKSQVSLSKSILSTGKKRRNKNGEHSIELVQK